MAVGTAGFCTQPHYAVVARARGYEEQAETLGLEPRILKDVNNGGFIRTIQEGRYTALFCHNDWLALTAMLLLSEHGIRVPEDVSVLGVDNSPTLIAMRPDLTTIAYPLDAIGKAAIGFLDGKTGAIDENEIRVIERKTVRSIVPGR